DLEREDITPTGLDVKSQAATPGKKANHIVLNFLVRAKGDWGGLMNLLEEFQRTPLLHRLRNLSIDQQQSGEKASGDKLAMTLSIEAMVVNRNDQRPDNLWGVDPRVLVLDAILGLNGQPAGWAMLLRGQALLVPEMPRRRYVELAQVNPFVGAMPYEGKR